MKTDKELKKELKAKASKNPDEYYATSVLRSEGFHRSNCIKCNLFFWSTDKKRIICGDNGCVGTFSVAGNTLCSKKLSYIDVWNSFKGHFEKRNYKAIKRYPVVARWNPTIDFTIASIAAFQPFVIAGVVEPPAKRLVIPQFCLRFVDIDNVGITGSHCTGFVMIGQHQFVKPEEWDQEKAFKDIYDFLIETLGLDKNELVLHEDAWAGGGNFGPCMEFFAAGLELFNQVYMMYEQLPNGETKELSQKVLDMGLGMERITWFSQGTANMYEAIFPITLGKVRERINIDYDIDLFSKFSVYAGNLNVDEVEDIAIAWDNVAKKIGIENGNKLKIQIMPMVAAYAITEHTRALLVALADGQLPSNSGGGYNLRVILRRSLSFIDKFKWDIRLEEIARWHAEELKGLFPELLENIEDVVKLLKVENRKYTESKKNAASILENISFKEMTTDKLIELYDSNGVTPELVKEYAVKNNHKVNVPENFYMLVAELQEKRAQKKNTIQEKEKILDEQTLSAIKETEILYYNDWNIPKFTAKVLFVEGKKVILDKSYFYPTSGGQEHDNGTISGINIESLHRIGKHIVHILKNEATFKEGGMVECQIDIARRKQLAQHHTAAHIVNAAARRVLGNHINQAGAHKKVNSAHLDITHFQALTKKEEEEIETEANKIIKEGIIVEKFFMPRTEAEQKFGVRIYQGGVAPGKTLRMVDIVGVDIEACGGTHLNNTFEAEKIIIINSSKISDGVVRIQYLAGDAAKQKLEGGAQITKDAAKLLSCSVAELPSYCSALFALWKKGRKAVKKGKAFTGELIVEKPEVCNGCDTEILELVAVIFRVQAEYVPKTIERFQKEIKEFVEKASANK